MSTAKRHIDVIARFKVDGSTYYRGVRRIMAAADRLAAHTRRASLVAAGAMVYAGKKALDLQRDIEGATMSLGTLIQQAAVSGTTFKQAFGEAETRVTLLRKAAAVLPGTFDEMRDSFATLVPVLGRAGLQLDDIQKAAERTVVAARLGFVQGGAATVARDFREILQGRGTERTTQTQAFIGQVPRLVAMAKRSQQDAASEMVRLLKVPADALAAYGKTFDAQFSTALDKGKELVLIGSKPLFKAATKQLTRLNAWMEQNEKRLERIAAQWGGRILGYIKQSVSFVRDDLWPVLKELASLSATIARHWKTIGTIYLSMKGAQAVNSLTGGLLGNALGGLLQGSMKGGLLGRAFTAVGGAGGVAAIGGAGLSVGTAALTWREVAREGDALARSLGRVNDVAESIAAFGRIQIGQAYHLGRADMGFRQMATVLLSKGSPLRTELDKPHVDAIAKIGRYVAAGKASDIQRQMLGEHQKRLNASGADRLATIPPETARELLRTYDEMKKGSVQTDSGITLQPGKRKPPVIDARNSTFITNIELTEGDPDRIALNIGHSITKAFRPRLPLALPAM